MGGIECFPDIIKMRYADTLAQSEYQREEKLQQIRRMEQLYEEIKAAADCLTIKDLKLNGTDLKKLGVEPGKKMGEILKHLLEDVLENPEHNTVEYLTGLVENMLAR